MEKITFILFAFAGLFLLAFGVSLLAALPTIWALNTLFGLSIPYDVSHTLATVVLLSPLVVIPCNKE